MADEGVAEDPRDAPVGERGRERDVAAGPARARPVRPPEPVEAVDVVDRGGGDAAALLDDQPGGRRAGVGRRGRRGRRDRRRGRGGGADPPAAQLPRPPARELDGHTAGGAPGAHDRARAEPVERTEARVRQDAPVAHEHDQLRPPHRPQPAQPHPLPDRQRLAGDRAARWCPAAARTRGGRRAQSRGHPARRPAPCGGGLHAERGAAPRPESSVRPREPQRRGDRRRVRRTVGRRLLRGRGRSGGEDAGQARAAGRPLACAPGVHRPSVSGGACARQPPTGWPGLRRALSRRGARSAGRRARRGRAWSSCGRSSDGGAAPRSPAPDGRCPPPARAAPRRARPRP